MKTSVSDNGTYPEFCLLAATEDAHFNTFKTNSVYTTILEHTSLNYANQYLTILIKRYGEEEVLKILNNVKVNDVYGGPVIENFFIGDKSIQISPSTINYTKIWSDISSLFGEVKNLKVCEIGGGYGGQALIANQISGFKQWDIVDLQEACLLQKKYLQKNKIYNSNSYHLEELENLLPKYDLFISNFAFSEVNREIQEIYLQKILKKCNKGYMIMNFGWDLNNLMTPEYLKSVILNLNIVDEVPKTGPNNCLIYW